MISRLEGTLIEKFISTEKNVSNLLIGIHGVGYDVIVSQQTFYRLPDEGETVTLQIHHVFREDNQQLFGFYEKSERLLFRSLIKVSGIGPKVALAILSGIEPAMFVKCLEENNVTALVRVPGVGKKMAERLIVEMRDKIDDWYSEAMRASISGEKHEAASSVSADFSHRQMMNDAVSALVALGYKSQHASRAVMNVKNVKQNNSNSSAPSSFNSETLIREALKELMAE